MRLFPKKMTEARTVKNFLVVVMMEQGSGPKSLTHRKMKNLKKDDSCYQLLKNSASFFSPDPEHLPQRRMLTARAHVDVFV